MDQGDITIRGGAQLERIVKALKEVGDGGLAKELSRELRKAARPMGPRVRKAIREIPSKHDGSLRKEMAAATRVQFRAAGPLAGITIRVDGRKMPSGKRSLPGYMEGTKPRWRHPVFGHDVWSQQPSHPFFFRTVEPFAKEVDHTINEVVKRVAKKLT